jgi:sugar lactone lactonase YvrE
VSTTTIPSTGRANAAVVAQAQSLCSHAISRIQPFLQSTATPPQIAALRRIVQSLAAPLGSLPISAGDQQVRTDALTNITEAETDLDRATAAAKTNATASATANFADATDHMSQISSVLQHYGAACTGAAQPTRVGTIAPTAEVAVGGFTSQLTATAQDVWVTRQDGRALVRVDPATNKVVATITVPDDDLKLSQVTSNGVWIRGANTMFRIDPATNRVVQTIAKSKIGANVTRAFVDDNAIWACNNNSIVRASKSDGTPVATIALPYRCGTVSSNNRQVWVTSDTGEPALMTKIDPSTNKIVFTVPAVSSGSFPQIGNGVVWTNSQDQGVKHPAVVGLNTSTGKPIATTKLGFGSGPGGLTATTFYVADTDLGLVDAIDTHTGKVLRTYDAGAEPNAVAVSGTTMWVVDEATGRLLRFDLAS